VRICARLPAGAGFAGVVDQVLGIGLLQPVQGERWAGAATQQSLPSRLVGSPDAHRRVHQKPAAMLPLRHVARGITVEQTATHEAAQQAVGA